MAFFRNVLDRASHTFQALREHVRPHRSQRHPAGESPFEATLHPEIHAMIGEYLNPADLGNLRLTSRVTRENYSQPQMTIKALRALGFDMSIKYNREHAEEILAAAASLQKMSSWELSGAQWDRQKEFIEKFPARKAFFTVGAGMGNTALAWKDENGKVGHSWSDRGFQGEKENLRAIQEFTRLKFKESFPQAEAEGSAA